MNDVETTRFRFSLANLMLAMVPVAFLLGAIHAMRQHESGTLQIVFLIASFYFCLFGIRLALIEGWRGLLKAALIMLLLLGGCAATFFILMLIFRFASDVAGPNGRPLFVLIGMALVYCIATTIVLPRRHRARWMGYAVLAFMLLLLLLPTVE